MMATCPQGHEYTTENTVYERNSRGYLYRKCRTCKIERSRAARARAAEREGRQLTPRKLPLDIRFWSNVEQRGDDECWPWLLRIDKHGYGRIRVAGRTEASHRIAYELAVGPIPEGLVIDHLCRNRGCQNPSHMEAVTNRENLDRGLRARQGAAK